jgi:hypothetical protein
MNSKIKVYKYGKKIKTINSRTDVFFEEIKHILNTDKTSKTTEKNLVEDFWIINQLWDTNKIEH